MKITQKLIKEMCGTVSFKRGDSFFRNKKVTFEHYSSDLCKATVKGVEDFHVTIEKKSNGEIQANCSCPKLMSFERDCQHIAAVLLAIYDHQRQGNIPAVIHSDNQKLTEGLMELFKESSVRSSGYQPHFENRQILELMFMCAPVMVNKGSGIIGIEIKIGTIVVQNIRYFLEQVRAGNVCILSPSFTFDPRLHCFEKTTNTVIQELIQVMDDEKVYVHYLPVNVNDHMLLIPPTSWERIRQALMNAPLVQLVHNGETFDGLHISDDPLPLHFELNEAPPDGFILKVNGLDKTVVLDSYGAVLFAGKMKQIGTQDCNRLSELIQMLEDSGTKHISLSQQQLLFFMEKVVPGLKKLGEVTISKEVTNQFQKTPLVAKLFLDRVRNRLLAGLEFHYGHYIINPLDKRELSSGSLMLRDKKKEEEILQLMEASSFSKTEEGYFLHNEELEYEFLYHMVPKLQHLVQIYATTAVRNRIFRGNSKPQIRVRVKKERINWLEFKFEMDGISLKQIKEVLSALEEKRKYYRLPNGSLLSLESREIKEIQRFLAPHIKNKEIAEGLELPIEQCLQLLDSIEVTNTFKLEESFLQFLDTLQHPEKLDFEVPISMETVLREYQKQGFKWMKTLAFYGFGGILADSMGLGKTVQSIAFILSGLPEIRKRKLPVLIVCPSSLTYNWLNEIRKFAPDLKPMVIDGDKKERSKLLKEASSKDVIITSYPLLRKDIDWFEKKTFYTVFFDEAQAFKNPLTQTARAVKKIQADHRFALTGTPVENSVEELWSIFHVVFPELFRGLKEFSQLSRKNIANRVRPFLLRRLKEEVLAELPEKIESIEAAEMLPEQKKLYAAYLAKLRHDTLKHLDKDTIRKNRIKILAGLTRLRQICCHPGLFVDDYKGSSAKFEQLLEMVEESKMAGRRVLIFSQFTKMLELIARELTAKELPFFYLDGQTPSEKRVELCNQFNKGERDFFLISLKAGGTGLNLMSADTVILYDTWWNPAVELQAADRAHRMGQKNVVQVIKLLSMGTIEEKMNALQEKKRHLAEEIIETEDKFESSLTDEDIRNIFTM